MIVKIESCLFEDDNNFQDLDNLFTFFEKGKHILFLDNDVCESNWANSVNKTKLEFCNNSFKNSAYIQPKEIQVKINDANDVQNKIYSLKDGYLLLENKVLIFLENGTSDKLFLNAIFKNFIPECEKINTALKSRWLKFRGVGGKTEIIKEIKNELEEYSEESLSPKYYHRIAVVLDSDKRHPNENLSNIHAELDSYCTQNGFNFHVLEKREVENYVPMEAFIELEANAIVSAYSDLNLQQQSYYDLEKGLVKPLNQLDADVRNLFENVNVGDVAVLRRGFKSIPDYSPKKAIPKLFAHENVNRDALIKKCGNSREFLEIIEKINTLL